MWHDDFTIARLPHSFPLSQSHLADQFRRTACPIVPSLASEGYAKELIPSQGLCRSPCECQQVFVLMLITDELIAPSKTKPAAAFWAFGFGVSQIVMNEITEVLFS